MICLGLGPGARLRGSSVATGSTTRLEAGELYSGGVGGGVIGSIVFAACLICCGTKSVSSAERAASIAAKRHCVVPSVLTVYD